MKKKHCIGPVKNNTKQYRINFINKIHFQTRSTLNKYLIATQLCSLTLCRISEARFLTSINTLDMVLSGIIDDDDECTPATFYRYHDNSTSAVKELALNHEEVDLRIIPHLNWSANSFPERKRAIVVSKDTDILVLLVHYMKSLKLNGINEVWMLTGQGDNKYLLTIHKPCDRLGEELCQSLLKCHLGSGCDYLSKIGTKHSALLAKPESNLKSFGNTGTLDIHQIDEAEKYL